MRTTLPGASRIASWMPRLRPAARSAGAEALQRVATAAGFAALVWALHLAVVLGKPVHVDDPHYLYAARHLLDEPLVPFGNTINWQAEPVLAYRENINPPAFLYVLAASMALVGDSIARLQLVASLAVPLAAACGWLVARRYTAHPRAATALVLLGPSALVGGNLMLDMPALALSLAACAAWLHGSERDDRRFTLLGALLAAAATLTKYPSMVLVPILVVHALLERRFRHLPTLLVVPGAIGVWCLHNALFAPGGEIHLLLTTSYAPYVKDGAFFWRNAQAAAVVLGSSFLFAGLLAPWWRRRPAGGWPWLAVLAVLLLLAPAQAAWWADPAYHARLELLAFSANALVLVAMAATGASAGAPFPGPRRLLDHLTGRAVLPERQREDLFLWTWALAVGASLVVFAFHQSPRYHLLALPPFAILLVRALERAASPRRARSLLAVSVALGMAVGLGLAAADRAHAAASRDYPEQARASLALDERRVFCLGHWGFQYYCEELGFTTFDAVTGEVRAGDVFLVPQHNDLANLPDGSLESPGRLAACGDGPGFRLLQEVRYPDDRDPLAASGIATDRAFAAVYRLWPFTVVDHPEVFFYAALVPAVPWSWLHVRQERSWQVGGWVDRFRAYEARCDQRLAFPATE